MFPFHAAWRTRKALFASSTIVLALIVTSAQTHDGVSRASVPDSRQGSAEVPAAAAPAHIAFVDGSATVERDSQSQPAVTNAPFVPGDRLRTMGGRAEVLFPDGTVLDADDNTVLDLQATDLVRLVSGSVILIVAGAGNSASAMRYQIDTPVASARAEGAGEYRIALIDGPGGLEAELEVRRGSGSLVTEHGAIPVSAGQRSFARDDGTPAFPQAYNSARFDAFDRWSEARRNNRIGAISARYLPRDLHMYGGTFDRYGSWQETPQYGSVWYPDVGPDWQPYHYGYWASYQPWGWTWIGLESWTWPTHHFGRWGFLGHRWFWIPGSTWAPAWVTWGAAPEFVSWCPLGWNERPVFRFSVGSEHRWRGWTVIPRSTFGLAAPVDRFAVASDQISPSTPFAFQRTPPVAVPRLTHASSTVAGPIGRTPRWNWPSPSSVAGVPPAGPAGRSRPLASGAGMAPTVRPSRQPLSNSSRVPAYAMPRGRAIPSSPTFSPGSPNRDSRAAARMSPALRAPKTARRGDWPGFGSAGTAARSHQTAPHASPSWPSHHDERQLWSRAARQQQAIPRAAFQGARAPAPPHEARPFEPAPRYNERPFAPASHYERHLAPPAPFARPASPPPAHHASSMPPPQNAPAAVSRPGNSARGSGDSPHGGGPGKSSSNEGHRRH
jgi:hypothetical protein